MPEPRTDRDQVAAMTLPSLRILELKLPAGMTDEDKSMAYEYLNLVMRTQGWHLPAERERARQLSCYAACEALQPLHTPPLERTDE